MKIAAPSVEGVALLRSPEKIDGDRAVREFDAYFLSQLLKSSNAGSEEHMLDGGSAGRMYRDYFYEEVGRVLAEHGAVGISQQIGDALEKKPSEDATNARREESA